jgi:hypothetical protein
VAFTDNATVELVAGAATQLSFFVQPTSTAANHTMTPPAEVEVQDAFGNRVTDFVGSITIAIGDDPSLGLAVLSGTLTVDVVDGLAVFDDLSVDVVGDGYTLVVTSTPELTGAESQSFNITLL